MANIIIGKVVPTFVGVYSPIKTYNKLDIVSYNGSSFVCMKDATIGITPIDDVTNWRLVAEKGEMGSLDYNLGDNTYNDY